ncbi:MAG: hypothetical protein FWE90_03970 [Defluviitaleaceae bacterium]|nr:hypothetical protein [Defluviitaleaceae bacterium]
MKLKIFAAALFVLACIGLYAAQAYANPNRFDLGPTNRTNNVNQQGWDFNHDQRQIVAGMRYLIIEVNIDAARAANPHGDIVGNVNLYFNGPNGWQSYSPWGATGFIPLEDANPIVIDMHASPRWNGFRTGLAEWGQIYLGYYGRTFADLHFINAYMSTSRPGQAPPAATPTPAPTPSPTPAPVVPRPGDIVLGEFTVNNNARQMGWEINYTQREAIANMRFLVLDIDAAAARQANPHGNIISNVNVILNGPIIQEVRNGQWHEHNYFGDMIPAHEATPIVIDLRAHPGYNNFINGLDEWGRILIAYYGSNIADLNLRRAFLTPTRPGTAPQATTGPGPSPAPTPAPTPPPAVYDPLAAPEVLELEPEVRTMLGLRLSRALSSNRNAELSFGDMYILAAEIHALATYGTLEIIAPAADMYAEEMGLLPADCDAGRAADFLMGSGVIHRFDWEDFFWFNLAEEAATHGELAKLIYQLVDRAQDAPRVNNHNQPVTRAVALEVFMGLLGR